MKFGFKLRKLFIEILDISRKFLDLFIYLIWLIFDPGKFKVIDNKKIKNLLVVYSGAIGDTYNVLAIINEILLKYKDLKVYYLTIKKNQAFIKNPKAIFTNLQTTKELISNKTIDAAVFLTNIPNQDLFDKEFYFKSLKIPYTISAITSSITTLFKQIPFSFTRRVFPRYKSTLGDQISAFELLGFRFNKKISFYYPPEPEKEANAFFKEIRKDKNQKIIFMHPGSAKITRAIAEGKTPSSAWINERWSELANILLNKYNCKILFTGSNDEKPMIQEIIFKIKDKKDILDLSGKFSLEQIASLFKRADLLISVDTSIAHIGAQTGIPLVDLMFCNSSLCGPHTDNKIEVSNSKTCFNCRRYSCPEGNAVCMNSISVQEVLNAADFFLKKS